MSDRRLATTDEEAGASQAPQRPRHEASLPMAERLTRPRSREEAETRYVAAREEWTAAMRAAGSGRPGDMAALAMAQEAYETALAERQRWASSPALAAPVDAERPTGLEAVVGQELSWRRVHESERERATPKGIGKLIRRITRR